MGVNLKGLSAYQVRFLSCLIASILVLMGRRSGGDFVADVPSDQRFQKCLNECN